MSNKSIRIRAVFVGICILVAYSMLVSLFTKHTIIVMLADVISGLAVIGIAVLLFPVFKEVRKKTTVIYLLLKAIEGSLMVCSGILYLSFSYRNVRALIYDKIHIYPFIFGALCLYYLIFKTKIVPRFIAVWGAAAIVALAVNNLLGAFGIHHALLDALLVLIISNEVFLAFWLFFNGFSASELRRNRDD